MAGHSKWKNIQYRKGAQDAKRGKIFTKLIKEISVAVKTSGNPDPETNPRLRSAIINAKSNNMPKDKIETAIKKSMGAGGEEYIETTYEGYGPDGVALFVESATDNKTRTVANIRSYFNKNSGSLGKDGCLQFIFNRKGVFTFNKGELDEEEFTLIAIDFGAEDIEFDNNIVTLTCEMEDFGVVQKKIEELHIELIDAGLQRIPIIRKDIGKSSLVTFLKLVDLLEEDDDVQKVYHNVNFDEELMKGLVVE